MDVPTLFQTSFELYKKHFRNLILIALITAAVWILWTVVMGFLAVVFGVGAIVMGEANSAFSFGLVGLAFMLLSVVVPIEVAFLGTIAMIVEIKSESPLTLGQVYNKAKPYLWPASVVALLAFIFVLLGVIVLIIPGLVLAFMYQFSNIVVVTENKTGTDALKRSFALVKKSFWEIAGRSLLLALILGVIGTLLKDADLINIIYRMLVLPYGLIYSYLLYQYAVKRSQGSK